MKNTNEENLKNIDERVIQYISLIIKTVFDVSELLEKRKELLKENDN